MQPDQNVIDISDSESEGSSFNYREDFLGHSNEPPHDDEAMDLDQSAPSMFGGPREAVHTFEQCLSEVLAILPDISRDYVRQLFDQQKVAAFPTYPPNNAVVAQGLIGSILDRGNYPKERDRIRDLKRKRNDRSTDEEETARWKGMIRREDSAEYAKIAKAALSESFEYIPVKFIQEIFKEHGHYYGAFFALLKAERDYASASAPRFLKLKSRRVNQGIDSARLMSISRSIGFDLEGLKQEIESAAQRRKREDAQRLLEEELEQAEEAKDLQHVMNGEVMDCGCCYETTTIPKLTHCNGEEPHFFCLECARRNANNDIGNSQYQLKCMDMSDCKATFTRAQRLRFLDEKTLEKLERLQQQEELRLADLENLSTCPFCDFAAIYPPVEENREFHCQNPECAEVSCRLCRLKSHIPATCEEHRKENGICERRVIEEARTEALVRTCGKCKIRILKEDGCNKVICTSCYAVLCDVCGKDITKEMYNHFDGEGGRVPPGLITKTGGKCALYDQSSKRKDQQVNAAEKEAMEKVRAEHPEISEEDLQIKFAKEVQDSTPRHHHHRRPHLGWVPPFPGQPLFDGFDGAGGGIRQADQNDPREYLLGQGLAHMAADLDGRQQRLQQLLQQQRQFLHQRRRTPIQGQDVLAQPDFNAYQAPLGQGRREALQPDGLGAAHGRFGGNIPYVPGILPPDRPFQEDDHLLSRNGPPRLPQPLQPLHDNGQLRASTRQATREQGQFRAATPYPDANPRGANEAGFQARNARRHIWARRGGSR